MTRQEIPPDRLAGATVVVLDVFLATTTLLAIFENGAGGVYPVGTLEEAEELRRRLTDPLRGGEQNAERIEGYDFGPSPVEFSAGGRRGAGCYLRDLQRDPGHRGIRFGGAGDRRVSAKRTRRGPLPGNGRD